MICLIHQTNYLLDQLLRQLEQQFLKEGGFTEKYTEREVPRETIGSSNPILLISDNV